MDDTDYALGTTNAAYNPNEGNDLGRMELLRAELAQPHAPGRSCLHGSVAERARVQVTRRIAAVHPPAAHYLETTDPSLGWRRRRRGTLFRRTERLAGGSKQCVERLDPKRESPRSPQ